MEIENVDFKRKELELNALLEVTMAINNNLPEDSLFKIFKFTCLPYLKVKSLVLYTKTGDTLTVKVSHGINESEVPVLPTNYFKRHSELTDAANFRSDFPVFALFERYIPVFHKSELLAVVLVKSSKGAILDLTFIQALINILVVAVENKRFARKQLEQERLRKEIEIASEVQQLLLPKNLPWRDKLKVKVSYQPHSMVGGDYYDFIEKDNNTFIFCIADVSGKGMPAAMLMSNFQAALRTLVRNTNDIGLIARELNTSVFENSGGERFITFFIGQYLIKERTLNYINAGHNLPILCQNEGRQVEALDAGTTILGAFEELPFLKQGVIENLNHFTVHLFTDGLTETFNDAQEYYGDERFYDFIKTHSLMDPERFHEYFFRELDVWRNGQPYIDDVTLLSIEVKP
ncbi:PP2C family protein-serine/threonine phosphatase [Penaeicola halotolerans]|uniref:PP2C family protein-serine/threonine phosphatase n=1 Tax=Penaeicola halotolerans TaxID=2793196 RepID=UPI001CF8B318|nr:SpoIIE family protein phosphatase [Penaeicola halotolerans]